jgi:hypothetical protein
VLAIYIFIGKLHPHMGSIEGIDPRAVCTARPVFLLDPCLEIEYECEPLLPLPLLLDIYEKWKLRK